MLDTSKKLAFQSVLIAADSNYGSTVYGAGGGPFLYPPGRWQWSRTFQTARQPSNARGTAVRVTDIEPMGRPVAK